MAKRVPVKQHTRSFPTGKKKAEKKAKKKVSKVAKKTAKSAQQNLLF